VPALTETSVSSLEQMQITRSESRVTSTRNLEISQAPQAQQVTGGSLCRGCGGGSPQMMYQTIFFSFVWGNENNDDNGSDYRQRPMMNNTKRLHVMKQTTMHLAISFNRIKAECAMRRQRDDLKRPGHRYHTIVAICTHIQRIKYVNMYQDTTAKQASIRIRTHV